MFGTNKLGDYASERASLTQIQRDRINREFIPANDRMEDALTQIARTHHGMPDLLTIYRTLRTDSFRKNQEFRREMRRVFLGIHQDGVPDKKGILGKVYAAYQENGGVSVEDIIQSAGIAAQQGAFFEQNPLLLPGMIQEIQKMTSENDGKMPTVEEVAKHIETTLPELFAPPLAKEPASYTSQAVGVLPDDEINITDWIHLNQAADRFLRYCKNLIAEGEFSSYPLDAQIKLHSLGVS